MNTEIQENITDVFAAAARQNQLILWKWTVLC